MIKRETQDSLANTAGASSPLSAAFGLSALDGDQVSLIHKIARAQENTILLSAGSQTIAGVMERGAALARNILEVRKAVQERHKRSADNVIFLDMLNDANSYAEWLAADVGRMESDYAAQYGDAWVEQIALEVLGADEIPERNEGEDIASYRDRVRETLLDTMIDSATGQVRPEHANSPHAQWAERAWRQREVDKQLEIATDESKPQSERDAAVQEVIDLRDHDKAAYAMASFEVGDQEYEALSSAATEIRAEATDADTQAELDSFFAP